VVKNLLIINVLVFLASVTLDRFNIDLNGILGLHFFKASEFHFYQFITYMFAHANFTHLFFNMFALWMFGNTLENYWGSQRFLLFYLVCGIGAGICQEVVQYIQYVTTLANYNTVNIQDQIVSMDVYLNMITTVGASGAVYGLLLAFGMMFPDSRIYLYFILPIKAKWFVIAYVVIELFLAFLASSNVAHFAHIGGMLFGFGLILYWRKKGVTGTPFNIKEWWRRMKSKKRMKYTRFTEVKDEPSVPSDDGEYNRQRADKERDIDSILDKVSKTGYGSLTDEEKEFLFRNSK